MFPAAILSTKKYACAFEKYRLVIAKHLQKKMLSTMKLFDTEDWFIKLCNETDHCISPGGMAGREDFDRVIIKFTPPKRLCKVLMNPPHWQAIINSPLLIVSKERLIPLRSVWKLCVSHKILSLPPPLLFKLESNCTFNGLIPPDL